MVAYNQNMNSKGAMEAVGNNPVLQKAVASLRRMRYFRRQYDQRRALFYRQYIGQRDQLKFPDNLTPRANTFVPYPLSNTETIVSRVQDAFFSFDPWHECKPRSAMDDAAAENMQIMLHDRLRRAGFVPAFETLVRNILIYGHAGIKVDWDWDYDLVDYMKPVPKLDSNGQPQMQVVMGPNGMPTQQPIIEGFQKAQKPVPRNRPKFIPIDCYDLYVDPDGGILAHLTEKTVAQLEREIQMNPTLYDQQALKLVIDRVRASQSEEKDAVIVRIAELWNEYEQTQTVLTFGEDHESISWKDLRASVRAGNYSPWKREIYRGEPVLLYHGPIPFNHKRAPILHTSFIKLPNEVYGLGNIEIISDLTESLNRFVNMITDNWNMGINRRYAYDTAADIDHEALNSFNVPGGKVAVSGDPSKVLMPLPFFTPQAGDYQILELYKGMIEMTSGVSDFYSKGVGSPTNNKTATGINQVLNESNFRFKMFMRNLEVDILAPLLSMCASMVQQFVTDDIEVQVTGNQPAIQKWQVLKPEDIIGTFDFDMVAANYATNKEVRKRTLLELINLLGQSPWINQYEAIKEVFKVFEVRNMNKLLKSPQQVAQEQQQAQQQQIEMMIFEAMLQTESKARLEQSKPRPTGAGQGAGGGGQNRKFTVPKEQPGAGLTDIIKGFAQSHGANKFGTRGNN